VQINPGCERPKLKRSLDGERLHRPRRKEGAGRELIVADR
jgi:hypothetical protein